ncbi:glutathione S-transferase family protein [Gimibacter soli]|uniref:Glutathione S-transferase family protein n=1 Tax=Gimibacter soli TaxID=3024400 RepID=A0AAE9XW61_9PROT|nr:glutathione S-transferase family protein [Gimibacter soli]WCL54309.1 glutathione S-transferase family protein [Gimibacter soli]
MTKRTVTAFKWVPPFAKGLVRDLRVRWALEEAGLPYDVRLISHEEKESPEYRALQPFAQVPVYIEDGVDLFESGAIVLNIAEQSETLLPKDPKARIKAISWMFAALNSVEGVVQQLATIDLFYPNEAWAKERRPEVVTMIERRLAAVADRLGDKDYLEGSFSAGDLLMATVLRILRHTDLVAGQPKLAAYLARCEARPAFQKALAGQLADLDEEAA